ncbi:glycosyltransferase [Polynucleobacter paneuropaeus]|nr:glycosyltransferase [Polynucleobacter paneuropaeus]
MGAGFKERKIFFLILDVQMTRSGIEASALARAALFENHLGIQPIIVTNSYNWAYDQNRRLLEQESRYKANFNILNMFDYFQNTVSFSSGQPLNPQDMDFYRLAPVDETHDFRGYDKSGAFVAYCKNNEDGTVAYVNYLQPDGFVWRRETYDTRGFLSKIDLLDRNDKGITSQDLYLRPNGTVALIKQCDVENNIATTKFIHLVNEQGRMTHSFNTEDDLLQYWLEKIISEHSDAIFIVDRCHVYSQVLNKALDANVNDCKVVSVLHNRHTGGDPMSAPVNEYFSCVLDDTTTSDALLMFTEQQKVDLDKRFDTQLKSRVIPHAHEQLLDIPSLEEREPLKVVYLARYAEEKQHGLALEAFKKAISKLPLAQLHCYGFGPKKEEIEKSILEMGLGQNVFLHEFVQNVENVYRQAGLSILCSSGEGFVLSILESLFCGCPVVAFDVNYGPAAMIKDGINGFLVPPDDVNQLANRIIEILENADLHSNLIKQSNPSMKPFTHEYVSELWHSELEKLTG